MYSQSFHLVYLRLFINVHLKVEFASTWLCLIGQQRRPVASRGRRLRRGLFDNTKHSV